MDCVLGRKKLYTWLLSLAAQVTKGRPNQNRSRYESSRRPSQPQAPALALHVRIDLKGWDFRDHRNRQQLLQLLLIINPVIHHLESTGNHNTQPQSDSEPNTTKLQAIRKVRLTWQAWRIDDPEAFTLLQ